MNLKYKIFIVWHRGIFRSVGDGTSDDQKWIAPPALILLHNILDVFINIYHDQLKK